MTRYFYDCPIKAAYMVRYHGMKIHGPARMPTGGIGTSTKPMPVWILARAIEHAEKGVGPEDARYYVAEESVTLLEPQVGDLLQSSRGVMGGISCGFLLNKEWHANPEKWTIAPRYGDGSALDRHWATPSEWQTIIQRNGVAFHTPESEAANGEPSAST